jgi:hypothetical protein
MQQISYFGTAKRACVSFFERRRVSGIKVRPVIVAVKSGLYGASKIADLQHRDHVIELVYHKRPRNNAE